MRGKRQLTIKTKRALDTKDDNDINNKTHNISKINAENHRNYQTEEWKLWTIKWHYYVTNNWAQDR